MPDPKPSATLYTFPFSCSLAVEIVLRQHDVPFEEVVVERGPARKVRGDFAQINPKQKVPAVSIDGSLLTEIPSVLIELDARFVPERASAERRRVLEWCCFVATELHQGVLGPFFDPDAPEGVKKDAVARILPPLIGYVERSLSELGDRSALVGTEPSGADAYLWWAIFLLRRIDAEQLGPSTNAYYERLRPYPFFKATMAAHRAMMGRMSAS